MRVLVTGGAGFIGSHLVLALLQKGNTVRVLDNFSTGKRENLILCKGELEILEGDLQDESAVKSAVREIEQIYHLAAFVSVPKSMEDPHTCFSVNVAGTVNLYEAARRAGVKKIILSSSTAVYGDPKTFPTNEEASLHPLSPYALSKQVNELYSQLYTTVFHLPVVILRYFNVYGPRQRPDSDYAAAISIFTHNLVKGKPITIYGDGRQSRDFIFVEDVVQANLLAASSPEAGEAFNICSGNETTLLDLLEQLSEFSPSALNVLFTEKRPGDVHRSFGKADKAAEKLHFRARTSLANGLAKTIEWMKTQ
jgi:UDP-glucose 4-epimerase